MKDAYPKTVAFQDILEKTIEYKIALNIASRNLQ